MNHLDFVNELDKSGVSVRSTTFENRERKINIHSAFGKDETVILKNNSANYEGGDYSIFARNSASQAIISKAIDFDSWKHSWHNEITFENYEKFQDIIQKKIIDRAKEIEELTAIYFHLNSELSNRKLVV